MKHAAIGFTLLGASLLGASLLGCAARSSSNEPGPASASPAMQSRPRGTPPPSNVNAEPQPSADEIPIEANDGVWGAALAPVTVVVFTDLQCPFCAEGHDALVELEHRYGEARLRVVIKHVPLANHPYAVPAARVAQAALALGGRAKFFAYLDRAFAAPEQVAVGRVLELATPLGLDMNRLRELAESPEIGRQILADVELADRLKVPATPHYRLNGLPITGVQAVDTLALLVDAELAAANRLTASGIPPNEIYARRVRENIVKREPAAEP